jgi:hypothetical protein
MTHGIREKGSRALTDLGGTATDGPILAISRTPL